MSDTTDRFALPFIIAGQAQKEVAHNEALARIDAALHPVAEDVPTNTPPGAPGLGQAWLVGGAPTGAWAGQANALATWSDGGWRFVAPVAGMLAWVAGAACWACWDGSGWSVGTLPATRLTIGGVQVVGARAAAIAAPSGGTVTDTAARSAIAAILAALQGHGLIA